MSGTIKNAGTWSQDIKEVWVKQSGIWVKAAEGYNKISGTWEKIFGDVAPPPVTTGNLFAQLGDLIITGDTVLTDFDGVEVNDLLIANGGTFNQEAYPYLSALLGSTLLSWESLIITNNGWIDNNNGLESVNPGNNNEAVLSLVIPIDAECDLRVSSEEGYDFFTVYNSSGDSVWQGSGEQTTTITLLESEGPYTFRYSKDGADGEGDDKAWIDRLEGLYPLVTVPTLPLKTPEPGSPFPYKIVADYTGGA